MQASALRHGVAKARLLATPKRIRIERATTRMLVAREQPALGDVTARAVRPAAARIPRESGSTAVDGVQVAAEL